MDIKSIAKKIDHALLNPSMSDADLRAGVKLAVEYDVASICVLPYYLNSVRQQLNENHKGTTVMLSTVIGFPHGTNTKETKLFETLQCLADGCQEVDFVCNISRVKSQDWAYVKDELMRGTEIVHSHNQIIKIIFENYYLTDDEKKKLCEICTELKCDFVKTSTGFAPTGATASDLKLMRQYSGKDVRVKASGGIRNAQTVLEFDALGVDRMGLSGTKAILDELKAK